MPRYYFHVHGHRSSIDEDGAELSDSSAAWCKATLIASEMMRDGCAELRPGQGWELEVTDEFRNSLFHQRPRATRRFLNGTMAPLVSRGNPMVGEDDRSTLDVAKEAVGSVTDTVQSASRKVAEAIEAGRQPGAPLDALAKWTREAPLHAVLVASLVGWMMGRRR
jgi:hypothetical protein